jgi:hypothetical protein
MAISSNISSQDKENLPRAASLPRICGVGTTTTIPVVVETEIVFCAKKPAVAGFCLFSILARLV